MTFEDLWNSKLKYIARFDFDVCKTMWRLAREHMAEDLSKFDNWWEYNGNKNAIKTTEQAARWAWTVQQCQIDKLEKELIEIAQLLDINTENVGIREIRATVLDKLRK